MPRRNRREPTSEEVPGIDRRQEPFKKTKMCKFNILGMCTRGDSCQFAHEREELNSLPDLFRTKLCKRLINTGACDDPQCRYAHNKEELRDHPIPRSDRSVRVGGHSGEDQGTAAYPCATATSQAPRRHMIQNMPLRPSAPSPLYPRVEDVPQPKVSHENINVGENQFTQFYMPAWGNGQKPPAMYGINVAHPPNTGADAGGGCQQVWFQEPVNMGYSPDRWPQGGFHFGGDENGFAFKGKRSCSSDTDTKSGFGSDSSSVSPPPDHLLGGDQFRNEYSSCADGRLANVGVLQALTVPNGNLRFENCQNVIMTPPSTVQEAEVAAGLPYIPCPSVPINSMNMNAYDAKVLTMTQGGYPTCTQPQGHVYGLAEVLGAQDCTVKNTFLNFTPTAPKLRNVQTAAGRLDLLDQE